MDLEKARKFKLKRTVLLETLGLTVVEKNHEESRSLSERYQSIIERAAEAVHDSPSNRDYPVTTSKAMFVMRTEGKLPNVFLGIKYYIAEDDSRNDGFGFNFTNQFGEKVIGVTIEWIHAPDAHDGPLEPIQVTDSYTDKLQLGEVFAEEYVNDPLQHIHMVASANSFTLVEQSLDVYEVLTNNERFPAGILGGRLASVSKTIAVHDRSDFNAPVVEVVSGRIVRGEMPETEEPKS